MYNNPLRSLFIFSVSILFIIQACGETESQTKVQIEEEIKSINGTELFVKRMGDGEPIIIVHGGPVLEHGYLVPYFKPLAENYELIYYDQRLSGRSSAEVDSSGITLANFVEDIEELRKEVGAEKIHLMAHSWGGLLAMKYAIKYPSHLNSLILLNSMPASTQLWQEESRMVANRTSREDSLKRQEIMQSELFRTNPSEAIEQLLVVSFRNQFENPALADSLNFFIPDDYMARSQRFGNLMPDLMNYDLHADLGSMQVPTLLVYGESEPAAMLSGSDLDSVMPNSKLVVMENSGHFPFIEQPEAFIDEIEGFLNSN